MLSEPPSVAAMGTIDLSVRSARSGFHYACVHITYITYNPLGPAVHAVTARTVDRNYRNYRTSTGPVRNLRTFTRLEPRP